MSTMGRKLQMAAAYILALPSLLLLVIVAPVAMLLALPSVALFVFRKKKFVPDNGMASAADASKQHAIITGGSSGIGLAIALDCVQRGMERVTILARNQEKLDKAKALLQEQESSTKVSAVSVDVCDPGAVAAAALKICSSTNNTGTTYLFSCAGIAYPATFQDIKPDIFEKQAQTNYLGTVNTVHAFLPFMKRGTIVLTSSPAAQVGIFGFTAYSPVKLALRGFAESLHMELICRDVNVQLAYPPDTDTPGYQAEQETKPKECHLISETTGLLQPEEVAKEMVRQAVKPNPKFTVYFGLEGWMLSTLTAGMSPEASIVDVVCQVGLMGLLRFVSFFYLNDFWDICWKCNRERENKKEN